MPEDTSPALVVINAMIYPWQREALTELQDKLGGASMSGALRFALNKALNVQASEQPGFFQQPTGPVPEAAA